MKANKVFILALGDTGFGDQYASILTAYNAFLELKEMGYSPQVGFLLMDYYYSSNNPLDVIYDMSGFNTEIQPVKVADFNLLKENYILLEKIKKTILIFVDRVNDELLSYDFKPYDRTGLPHIKQYKDKTQFIQKDILDIASNYIGNRKNFIGIHFRCNDTLLEASFEEVVNYEFYNNEVQKLENYLKSNTDTEIMLTSNNSSVKEYFKTRYNNIFTNKFTYSNLKFYNIDAVLRDDSINILHSKEIIAEMTLFSKCKEIYGINTFPSNFLTYGIVHNEIYEDWESKQKIVKNL